MLFNIISILIGIIGIVLSAISILLFLKEKQKNRTIYWKDIPVAASSLSEKMRKEFNPDIILIPNEKGGVIANFFKKSFPSYINCIFGVGIPIKRINISETNFISDDFYFFKTQKWYAYIPKYISHYKDKRILIIDDFAMTGDFLIELKRTLINHAGFKEQNIKTMCIATTEFSVENGKSPDYYWKKFDSSKVYLPWGRPE